MISMIDMSLGPCRRIRLTLPRKLPMNTRGRPDSLVIIDRLRVKNPAHRSRAHGLRIRILMSIVPLEHLSDEWILGQSWDMGL